MLYHEKSYEDGRKGIFGASSGHYDHISWAAGREERLASWNGASTNANAGSVGYVGWNISNSAGGSSGAGYLLLAGVGIVVVGKILSAVFRFLFSIQDEIGVLVLGSFIAAVIWKLWRVFVHADSSLLTKSLYLLSLIFTAFGVAFAEYLLLTGEYRPGVFVQYAVRSVSSLLASDTRVAVAEGLGVICSAVAFFLAKDGGKMMFLPLLPLCVAGGFIATIVNL